MVINMSIKVHSKNVIKYGRKYLGIKNLRNGLIQYNKLDFLQKV